VQFGDL
jgi:hypothetical protein